VKKLEKVRHSVGRFERANFPSRALSVEHLPPAAAAAAEAEAAAEEEPAAELHLS
jgi:hypothetical protein